MNIDDEKNLRMDFETFLFQNAFRYTRQCDCGGSRSNVYTLSSPRLTLKHNIRLKKFRLLKNSRQLIPGEAWKKINPVDDAKKIILDAIDSERQRINEEHARAKTQNDSITKRSSTIFRRKQ